MEIIKKQQDYDLQTLEKMASYVTRSGLFGVRDPSQAITLMLLAQAEGLHPMEAIRQYHIIDGRPAMRADAMLAKFQLAGGRVQWLERSDTAAEAEFSHPQGGTVRVRWTIEDAQRAGLAGRDNWRRYPRAMLSARVISEGIRAVYPAVIVGVYTPEEVFDFGPSGLVDQGASQVTLGQPEALLAEAEPKPEPVIEAEVSAPAGPAQEAATPAQLRKIAILFKDLGLGGDAAREARLQMASEVIGRQVASSRELTRREASRLITYLEERLAQASEEPEVQE